MIAASSATQHASTRDVERSDASVIAEVDGGWTEIAAAQLWMTAPSSIRAMLMSAVDSVAGAFEVDGVRLEFD